MVSLYKNLLAATVLLAVGAVWSLLETVHGAPPSFPAHALIFGSLIFMTVQIARYWWLREYLCNQEKAKQYADMQREYLLRNQEEAKQGADVQR